MIILLGKSIREKFFKGVSVQRSVFEYAVANTHGRVCHITLAVMKLDSAVRIRAREA